MKHERGFTLVELVAVILLIVAITTLAVSRLDSIRGWKQRSSMRSFLHTWEFLYSEALGRAEFYRLVINIDENSYYVRREVQPEGTLFKQVDYLKNLRTKGEKERRAKQELEAAGSLEEEFKEEDIRQSAPLENLFYQMLFSDPEADKRLVLPLEFPALAEVQHLADDLKIIDIATAAGVADTGEVAIRFSPRGASDFAVIHLAAGEQRFTAMMNPSTGEIEVKDGIVDYEWTYGNPGKKRA